MKSLHIISFDVPYPPDYGGVIDVFYKMKALSEKGIKINLHCFEYGRKENNELNKFADNVFYYQRKNSKSLLFNTLPYIVLSRNSEELKKNLQNDLAPVLMEGMHSTFLLNDGAFKERLTVVRTHNIEHEYYEGLSRTEKNIFKRYYFHNEAGKLKKYESVLSDAKAIAAISPADTAYYMHKFQGVHYIPAFHPFDEVKILPGKGDFALYHGNLSVGENDEAALFLVQKVFKYLRHKLVIAGSRPSVELKNAVGNSDNVELRDDLNHHQMLKMISEAQCNILPTFQSTGIKLKLLTALYCGRTCIVNTPMVMNTGLESLCVISDTAEELQESINDAMHITFHPDGIIRRKEILLSDFSNKKNAEKLISLFYPDQK
jgi:hypothetical protein